MFGGKYTKHSQRIGRRKKLKTLHCPTGQLLFKGNMFEDKHPRLWSLQVDCRLHQWWTSPFIGYQKFEVGGSRSNLTLLRMMWCQFGIDSFLLIPPRLVLEFRCVYRYVYCRSFEAPAVKLPFDVPTCQDHHFEIPHPSEHVKKNKTFFRCIPQKWDSFHIRSQKTHTF